MINDISSLELIAIEESNFQRYNSKVIACYKIGLTADRAQIIESAKWSDTST